MSDKSTEKFTGQEVKSFRVGHELEIPTNLPQGSAIIFGRAPLTVPQGGKTYENEQHIRLQPELGNFDHTTMGRRVFGLISWPDGALTIINTSTKRPLRYGLNENDRKFIDPNKTAYISPGSDLRNLRIDVNPGKFSLHAGSVRGGTGVPNHLATLFFNKNI